MISIASTCVHIPLILDNYNRLVERQFVWKLAQNISGFLLEKNLRGGAKDNRSLFFKQQAIVSIVLSIVFLKILGRQTPFFGGGKSRFGGGPAPCSRKPTFIALLCHLRLI